MRYHAMQDDHSGHVTLIACRVSREAADAEATRAERERSLRDVEPPLITWVEPAPPNCGHP